MNDVKALSRFRRILAPAAAILAMVMLSGCIVAPPGYYGRPYYHPYRYWW
jgi:hypothetical protein